MAFQPCAGCLVSLPLRQLATIADGDNLARLAGAAAVRLDLLHDIHALAHMPEDDVLPCPNCRRYSDALQALGVEARKF